MSDKFSYDDAIKIEEIVKMPTTVPERQPTYRQAFDPEDVEKINQIGKMPHEKRPIYPAKP